MEQKVVSLVRRSWGIDGRSDLLDMIRYLAQEGYILRYQLYGEAASPEEDLAESEAEPEVEAAFVEDTKVPEAEEASEEEEEPEKIDETAE